MRLLPILLFTSLTLLACGGITSHGEMEEVLATHDETAETRVFPWKGEQVAYTVSMAGAEILHAALAAGSEQLTEDGVPYIPVSGVAESIPGTLFGSIYPITDSAEAYIDPQTWRPFRSITDLHEKDKSRTYYVDYDFKGFIARAEKHTPTGVHKRFKHIPLNTHSSLSWIYAMRSMPLGDGAQMSWYEYDGWKLNRFTLIAQAAEEIWTPIGFFDTWRVDIYREVLNSHIPEGALAGVYNEPQLTTVDPRKFIGNVWLSSDERRIPVRMGISTTLGDIEILLTEYHPPTS